MPDDFDNLFSQIKTFKKPPLEHWHPTKVVNIDLAIKANGEWFYQGTVIGRHRLVKLFSTVLRKDGDAYYLVTPQLKYVIDVEEVPFRAVELNQQKSGVDQKLYFRTNMDDVVLADANHPIIINVDENTQQPSPYITIRDGLQAKINRSVFYELVELLQSRASIEGKLLGSMNKSNNVSDEGALTFKDSSLNQDFGVYSDGVFLPSDKA